MSPKPLLSARICLCAKCELTLSVRLLCSFRQPLRSTMFSSASSLGSVSCSESQLSCDVKRLFLFLPHVLLCCKCRCTPQWWPSRDLISLSALLSLFYGGPLEKRVMTLTCRRRSFTFPSSFVSLSHLGDSF